jgi:hypothetical protein
MFTVFRTTTNLSLDEHFIKHPAGTFFVKVEGDGMVDHGVFKGDTLIIDKSFNPEKNSIVVVAAKLPNKAGPPQWRTAIALGVATVPCHNGHNCLSGEKTREF